MASAKTMGKWVTTLKIVVVGWSVLAAGYVLLDYLGEWNYSRRTRLRGARRVAAAIASREAATGRAVRSVAELGTPWCTDDDACLFPGPEYLGALKTIELKEDPRRACVEDSCSEINPRERCVGALCARVELAPLDANVPTPGLEACEPKVIEALRTASCVQQLSRSCSTRPTSFEVVVDAELRFRLSGDRKSCRAQARTTDGKLIIFYWGPRGVAWEQGVEVLAGVTTLPRSPNEVATVMCGGCRGVVRSLDADAGWELEWD